MRTRYVVTAHTTPEGKTYIGMSSRSTWKYEHHYRGSALEAEANRFGWHSITHTVIAEDLYKDKAIRLREKLIAEYGESCLNHRAFLKDNVKPKKEKQMKERQFDMMTATANGVKLSLTFDNRYESKGGYPIVIRVYKDKKWCYVPTGFKMGVSDFKRMTPSEEKVLADKFTVLKDWCAKSVAEGTFSLSGAKECLKEKKCASTLSGLMELKMATLTNMSSRRSYVSAKKWIDNTFPKGLSVNDVSPQSIEKIVKNMRDNDVNDTSMRIYLAVIKAAINYGMYKEMFDPKNYPFKKNQWECDKIVLPKAAKRSDRWLTIDEIREVWDKFIETKDRWLGLFMFSYLTGGMNLADMMDLKFTKEWLTKKTIRWVRKKTAHKKTDTITVPVSSHIEKLLNVMGIEPKEGTMVFDFLEGEYFSKKAVATMMIKSQLSKFKFGISMTYARHSFATIATKTRMPATMVEQAMGHSLSGVSSHYIAGWDVEEMKPYFEELL